MCRCAFGCPVALHARKEDVIRFLLSSENRALLKYYRYALRNDPDYLRFHGSSTALRLCSVLMLREYPQLAIGDSAEAPGNCCVLEALEEAIELLEKQETVLPKMNRIPAELRL